MKIITKATAIHDNTRVLSHVLEHNCKRFILKNITKTGPDFSYSKYSVICVDGLVEVSVKGFAAGIDFILGN